MNKEATHPLKVFLCHASGDKPPVRDLYKRLVAEGVDAWLDQEKLLPGQDWRLEIPRAVHEADVVVVCLSKKSVTKEGYVQKEIKFALDSAEEKPEGTIFLIPARLEDCTVPERLSRWQWVDLYEENGLVKLLRSLKLRADVVGATIEPASYEDSDKELERRIKQMYTEGLAAFYTEDWDKACQRFQTILSEHPNHKNAAEKLEEAKRQRNLAKLYTQSTEAVHAENWQVAIQTLEELSQKSADYKDAGQLLRNARKQKQLKELYAEAKTLHEAQKWEAVLKVFEQISAIEPAYPDPDGLLPIAQKEVAEIKRLSDLNDLYSNAVSEMDAGHWHEAHRLLEQVQRAPGFLETERLLRKAEDEIKKVEEHNKRNEQVNVLYEQAHGLLRSKKWRKALDKMEEIRGLDEQFVDKDGISEKAKTELAREEREAQREDELSAKYAEAVRLLKEEKYQEALDKWQEVKALDPKYPDRQWVQRTSKKKLTETAKPIQIKPRFTISKPLWMGIMGLIAIGAVITGIIISGQDSQKPFLTSTSAPTKSVVISPPATNASEKTSTPRTATPVPTTSEYADPTMYDDFNAPTANLDSSKWNIDPSAKIIVQNGVLTITTNEYGQYAGTSARHLQNNVVNSPLFFELRFMLEPNQNGGTDMGLGFGDKGFVSCQIWGANGSQAINCSGNLFNENKGIISKSKEIIQGTWHSIRIEVNPSTMIFTYYVDGLWVGDYTHDRADELKGVQFTASIGSGCTGGGCIDKSSRTITGHFDDVRVGAIEDDPQILANDNFNDSKYDNGYNNNKWIPWNFDSGAQLYQRDGELVLIQTKDGGPGLTPDMDIPSSTKVIIVQADLMVDAVDNNGQTELHVYTNKRNIICGLRSWQKFCFYISPSGKYTDIAKTSPAQNGDWYNFTVELDSINQTATIYVNNKLFGTLVLDINEHLTDVHIGSWNGSGKLSKGYVDNVRIMTMDQP